MNNCIGNVVNLVSPKEGLHGMDYGGLLFSNVSRSETIPSEISVRKGKACQNSILFVVASFGDASVPEAARLGGIKTVTHVAYESFRILGFLFMRDCVVVYGD